MESCNEDVLNGHTYADIGQIAVDRHIIDHNYYIVIIEENEAPIDNYEAAIYCVATGIINIKNQENYLDLHPDGHNYGAVDVDMDMPFLRQAVGKRSTAIGAMSLPIRCKRMRNRRRPKISEIIQELVNLLNMQEHNHYSTSLQEPPSTFFQQALILEGVFVGELQDVKSAGCDDTFKTVPSTPKQLKRGSLMTFYVVYKNVSFPMVYALSTSATEKTYTAFFQIVRHLLPLNYDNLTIISDFERGLMNAVTMSIVRYCCRKNNLVYDLIKTNVITANMLRMILALAHLPATRGHADCQQFCIEDDVYNRMQTFLFEYVQNFWLNQVGLAFISVFGSEIRTNIYLKSFQSQLLRFFGNHPNIWDFLQKLRILENQLFVEFIQASKNLTIRDQTSRCEQATNTHMLKRAIE
ncbi:hypothetical protein QTP88_020907 [Uroleucon formosanum]